MNIKDQIKFEDLDETTILRVSTILNQWNEVITQLETLQSCFESRILNNQFFRENIIATNMDLELGINKTEDMGSFLYDEIGSPMEDLRGMTVWEGIQKLSTDSSRLKRDLESLKPSMVLWDDLKIVNNDIANLKTSIFLFKKTKWNYG